ncbi:MAG: IS21 family transposase [Pseudobutyrivibrio sp.]|nr:IS21 family transposase [Pseudobutyrivibrio sp.]
MKDLEDWAAVQKVYKQTKSKRATAQILGISRNTVKKLLAMDKPPTYNRKIYHSKIDSFKEQIIEWRCDPYNFNGTRIFRELKAIGYQGSIGPVYRFLNKIDEDVGYHISKRATVRHESPCGDQAQFDWTEYEVLVGSRYRKVYCFAMILAASRKKAVCFSLKSDAAAIYEAIQELFDDLGGVTLELLIDNPKALVLENNPRSEAEIRYNPHALMVAKHLNTELNACPCYWPRKKGKIERPFKYIEEQFIKGNSFATMEELNHRGKKFVDDWCNETHTTTGRIPNQHYLLEEKATLLELPKTHYHMEALKTRKVSPDSFVSIEGNKYSVPVTYVDRNVFYRIIYGFRIEIYDKNERLILRQEAFDTKRNVLTNDEHYAQIAPKVNTSIPQIRRDFTERFRNGSRYLEAAGRRFDQPTHHARRILELQELYDDNVLDYFIGVAIDEDMMDITSFRALLRDYNNGYRTLLDESRNQAPSKNELIRDCSYYEESAKEVAK